MNREQLIEMDKNILLSLINMKLRDEFRSFQDLCKEYDVEEVEIESKLKLIGYKYNEKTNQFISVEV